MNDKLQSRYELFIKNYYIFKNGFAWDEHMFYPLCANLFTEKNLTADIEQLRVIKDLVKSKTGMFSYFRGSSILVTIAALGVDANPKQKLEKALMIYDLLKKEFFSSYYLPTAALMLADLVLADQLEATVSRTKQIYNLMKSKHPFLTSGEDSTFAALLAMSDLSNEQLVDEMERCYQLLREKFYSGSVQSLSHVLTLGEGLPERKSQLTIELYEAFKSSGLRYGKSYELPALGVLALLQVDIKTLISEVTEVDNLLKGEKGFGAFGIGAKQRLMYAGMIVSGEYIDSISKKTAATAAISGAISIVVAQQAAMCAVIAGCAVASSASS
jgi:hypothetical protein